MSTCTFLFVSSRDVHAPLSHQTIANDARWEMAACGINTRQWPPHAIRGAIATHHLWRGVPIQDVMSLGGWTSFSTFTRFYARAAQRHPWAASLFGSGASPGYLGSTHFWESGDASGCVTKVREVNQPTVNLSDHSEAEPDEQKCPPEARRSYLVHSLLSSSDSDSSSSTVSSTSSASVHTAPVPRTPPVHTPTQPPLPKTGLSFAQIRRRRLLASRRKRPVAARVHPRV